MYEKSHVIQCKCKVEYLENYFRPIKNCFIFELRDRNVPTYTKYTYS